MSFPGLLPLLCDLIFFQPSNSLDLAFVLGCELDEELSTTRHDTTRAFDLLCTAPAFCGILTRLSVRKQMGACLLSTNRAPTLLWHSLG